MIKVNYKVLLASIVVAIAFLSYNNNALFVASDKLFREHQIDSEQLVLDGILHGYNSDGDLRLGRYTRTGIKDQSLYAHEQYGDKNKTGAFIEYRSQFGLQLYVFNYFASFFSGNVQYLQAIPSFLMSCVVGLFFIGIYKEFSLKYAIYFSIPLVLSPWVVIFARNLYWVEATWYFPTLVTFFFGKRAFLSINDALKMSILVCTAFLIKLLCGYEYVTAIAVSACVPLIYYAIEYGFGLKRGLVLSVICGISLVIAFFLAITIHVYSLNKDSNVALNEIVLLAEKRVAVKDPVAVAKEVCRNSENPVVCEREWLENYKESLYSNGFSVTGRYFIVPHFLPWLDRFSVSPVDSLLLRRFTDKPSLISFFDLVNKLNIQSAIAIVLSKLSYFIFLVFNIFVIRSGLKKRDALSVAVLFAILAPLSWFVMAKGHSFIHYHMNYVLWYLPYMSFAVLVLLKKNVNVTNEGVNR